MIRSSDKISHHLSRLHWPFRHGATQSRSKRREVDITRDGARRKALQISQRLLEGFAERSLPVRLVHCSTLPIAVLVLNRTLGVTGRLNIRKTT